MKDIILPIIGVVMFIAIPCTFAWSIERKNERINSEYKKHCNSLIDSGNKALWIEEAGMCFLIGADGKLIKVGK